MPAAGLINRPCTLIRRTGDSDDFDDSLPDEAYVDTVWEVQQVSRDEPAGRAELSQTTWRAFFLPGTAIDNGDAVLDHIDGAEYQLVGAPWPARDPETEVESHIEATAVLTRGPERGS